MKTSKVVCGWVGCGDSIDPSVRFEHEAVCVFKPVACTHCGEMWRSFDVREHENVCPEKPLACKQCGSNVAQNRMNYHLEQNCPARMVSCVNGCGTILEYQSQGSHNNVCEEFPEQCPFVKFGCTVESLPRGKLHLHIEKAAGDHALLLAKTFKEDNSPSSGNNSKPVQNATESKTASTSSTSSNDGDKPGVEDFLRNHVCGDEPLYPVLERVAQTVAEGCNKFMEGHHRGGCKRHVQDEKEQSGGACKKPVTSCASRSQQGCRKFRMIPKVWMIFWCVIIANLLPCLMHFLGFFMIVAGAVSIVKDRKRNLCALNQDDQENVLNLFPLLIGVSCFGLWPLIMVVFLSNLHNRLNGTKLATFS